MWPWNRDVSLPAPVGLLDKDVDPSAMNSQLTTLDQHFETRMKSQNFGAAFDGDSDGGFFGQEFNIQTTATKVKALYSREPWVHASASLIAKTMASIPMRIWDTNKEEFIEKHPAESIINASGKAAEDPMHLRWSANLDLVLAGNSFIVFDETFTKIFLVPVELVSLNFDTSRTKVKSITVSAAGGTGGQYGIEIPIERVVHHKLPNPFNPFFGMSAYAAAARPILLDRYQSEYEMAFYLRGATNAGVIETQQDIGKSRLERMLRSFESAFTGKRNWWRTLFLPKGAKWVNSSFSMKDITHLELKEDNRKTLLAVLNIPPAMLGIIQDVNRATSEQQEREFWQNTIVPYAMFVASGWNSSYFMKKMHPGLEVRPDFSGIEALEGSTVSKGEQSRAMESTHHIDEIREKVWGDDPLPNGQGEQFFAQIRGAGAQIPGQLAMKGPSNVYDRDTIHAFALAKDQYSIAEARLWLDQNDYPNWIQEDSNDTDLLFVFIAADQFIEGSFERHKIIDGVHVVTGRRIGKSIDLENRQNEVVRQKQRVIESQDRIERQIGNLLGPSIKRNIERMIERTLKGLDSGRDVRVFIEAGVDDRAALWWKDVVDVMQKALERGFTFSTSQTRGAQSEIQKKDIDARFSGFSDLDVQAIEVLRDKERDGQRTILAQRGIERFLGFDSTMTDMAMSFIEDGFKKGDGVEQIARRIRSELGESYRNQARTIVRTESLSAVSQGLAWNGEVLKQVFNDLDKHWIASGKATGRPDHIALEEQGPIPQDQEWRSESGNNLAYPRDPQAGAEDIINCGCSMAFTVRDGAQSNAAAILETES